MRETERKRQRIKERYERSCERGKKRERDGE